MSSAMQNLDDGIRRSHHMVVGLLLLLLVLVGWWMTRFSLDVVSITQGEVVPYSQVKQVQHLEGGIVRRILVREGDKVTAGQPLIELQSISRGADMEEIDARLLTLKLEVARLQAEAQGLIRPNFDDELAKRHPQLVERSLNLFQSRQRSHQQTLSALREEAVQKQRIIQQVEAKLRNRRERLKLVKEQVNISKKLLARDISNRFDHLNLLKEANAIQGEIDSDSMSRLRSQAALKKARAELAESDFTFKSDAQERLSELRSELTEMLARRNKFADSLSRMVLTAPVDGVIKSLHVVTEGGVLAPGATAVELVPGGDRLIIEARLAIQDIGYVSVDQSAQVMLASSDAARFGRIQGRVMHISPDSLLTEGGDPYYKVHIETQQSAFEQGSLRYRLFPGLMVQAMIHTGQRTLLEYMVSPFLSYMGGALSER
uniref:Membrane fusion protein (MFP) family protein n=1 Tax=Magnetococcus massalia (strain MO-1) TaxID=451514 RepID=A0A1S7LIT2_MAGMO|nr:putative Type I secretion membrane fusion protein, HlyD family [Candidatus Magnetococcus massalia]